MRLEARRGERIVEIIGIGRNGTRPSYKCRTKCFHRLQLNSDLTWRWNLFSISFCNFQRRILSIVRFGLINGKECFLFLIEIFVISSLFIEISRIESKRNNYSIFVACPSLKSIRGRVKNVIGADEPSKSVNLGVYRAVRFPRQSAIAVAVST